MKAPFPYFGGKSIIAPVVWRRLGDVPNYVEPFCGSAAVLLARPARHTGKTETINDKDGLVANFWRAVKHAPDKVAKYADWPLNENDFHARHAWVLAQLPDLVPRLEGDPHYYHSKIAGWWLWGISMDIGSDWCSGKGPWHVVDGRLVNSREAGVRPPPNGGLTRKLPNIGGGGRGILRAPIARHVEDVELAWRRHIQETMRRLTQRLRRVRVCSGDWSRVLTYSPTTNLGTTGILLDPPYSHAERHDTIYRHEMPVADAVREWAIEHGTDPLMRIALCGYEGEHQMPDDWTALAWKATGGYGNQGKDADTRAKANAGRETIWFSPHCLKPGAVAVPLFEME